MTEDLKNRIATEQGLRDVMKEWNVDVTTEGDGFMAHGVHGEFDAVGAGPTVGDAVSAVVSELTQKEDAQLKETVEEGMKITTLDAALHWLIDHPKIVSKFEEFVDRKLSWPGFCEGTHVSDLIGEVQSYTIMQETLKNALVEAKRHYLEDVAQIKNDIAWWEDALNTDEGK